MAAANWNSVCHFRSYHRNAPDISRVICSVCQDADVQATADPALTVFHTATQPAVTVQRYIMRLIKYSGCSPSVLVVMFILLDRFARITPLTSRVVHRAMAAAFIVASITVDDALVKYSFYAHLCGLRDASEVHQLVCAFFSKVDFDVQVPTWLFDDVEKALRRETA